MCAVDKLASSPWEEIHARQAVNRTQQLQLFSALQTAAMLTRYMAVLLHLESDNADGRVLLRRALLAQASIYK